MVEAAAPTTAGHANVSILLMDPSEMSTEDKVLRVCSRNEIVPFAELYSLDVLQNSKKVSKIRSAS